MARATKEIQDFLRVHGLKPKEVADPFNQLKPAVLEMTGLEQKRS
jgi:hypothetical protein